MSNTYKTTDSSTKGRSKCSQSGATLVEAALCISILIIWSIYFLGILKEMYFRVQFDKRSFEALRSALLSPNLENGTLQKHIGVELTDSLVNFGVTRDSISIFRFLDDSEECCTVTELDQLTRNSRCSKPSQEWVNNFVWITIEGNTPWYRVVIPVFLR